MEICRLSVINTGGMGREGKSAIRARLLEARRAMGHEAWLAGSESVFLRLRGLRELQSASRVHCYVAIGQDREVATVPLLEWLAAQRKAVYMPYIDQGRMRCARYLPGHCFTSMRNGPPVPDPLLVSDESGFDAVIVPLVAVDCSGTRIGYGRGWYDRFFAELRAAGSRPLKIGVCFGFQLLDALRPDPWDEPLDIVVTENGIINCRSSWK